MQIKLKVPNDATLAHAIGEVGKKLRVEVRKLRRETWPDMPDRLRPWPICRLLKVSRSTVEYDISIDHAGA